MPAQPEHISVTEASARGVARLAADAAHGAEVVVTRRGEPLAAVISVERLAALDDLRDDLRDLALVIGRGADDDGRRIGIDDVLGAFGQSRDVLAARQDDADDSRTPFGRRPAG